MNKLGKVKHVFYGLVLGIILIIGLFTLFYFLPINYSIDFIIEETEEKLNGEIYLGNNFLGETSKGVFVADQYDLYPGELSIKGKYNGESFVFYCDLTREDIDNLEYFSCLIPKKEIDSLSFKAVSINKKEIEDQIFDKINAERRKRGITELKRSFILDNLATEYSIKMANENFYAHQREDGITLHDRMNERRIFNFAATENLNYLVVSPETDVAAETVKGWIESPGHRVPVLDDDVPIIWDHIGIGVECVDDEEILSPICYITAEFSGFETQIEDNLRKDYNQVYELYPTSLGLDFETTINLDFKSDEPIDIILVPKSEEFSRYIKDQSFSKIFDKKNVKDYNDKIIIKPGYSLIVGGFHSETDYTIKLKYNAN